MNNDTIIVTGGAGFIGSNIVQALNQRSQHEIIIVDSLGTDEKWKNLHGLEVEDILQPQTFIDLVQQRRIPSPAAVIHMGACSSTTEKDADYLLENNYRFTRILCEWALEQNVRFITASSAATYGDGSKGYSDSDEITPTLRPLNMYGMSKHLFDLWALRHHYYRHIVGLKFFNVYGPNEEHKGDMRSVVSKAFQQIRAEGKLKLFRSYHPDYADGEQKRDFIYVKDAVDVVLYFLDHPDRNGLVNCGTGKARTWLDLGRAVFAALNLEPNIEFIPMPDELQGKYQYFTQAD
ncbi:MAG: ADP-glyceromanno-heptose 6-epimerase, partial [Lentisphaerae bacterium]